MPEQNGGAVSSGRNPYRVVAGRPNCLELYNPDGLGDFNVDSARLVLRRAYTLVMRGWCRRHMAVDASGRSTFWPEAGEPVAWSLLGAVKTGDAAGYAAQQLLKRLTGSIDLQQWNDAPLRTKRQVLDVLSLAIGQCGGRAPRAGGWRIGRQSK